MTVRAARMTPPGTGAVATIAVVGENAWSLIQSSFNARRKIPNASPLPGSIILGHFGEPPGDEVVLTVRPDSSIPWIEIHCHGGPQVVAWLLEQVAQLGATIVDWSDLEAPNCHDTICARAMKALPHALTARTARVLLDQYHGAFSNEANSIVALFEAHQPNAARLKLERLAALVGVGQHLTKPWRVAVCGPPNAGKSSLVNALAGYQRAVVTPTPGTTRDVVSTLLAFDGWPIEMLDTAGVRESADELESAGIRLGLAAAENADLMLWVTEPRQYEDPPPTLSRPLPVFNKCDLGQQSDRDGVAVSATTGAGIEELMATIVNWLIPVVPQSGDAVPFTTQLGDAILAAQQAWDAGEQSRVRDLLAGLVSTADSA